MDLNKSREYFDPAKITNFCHIVGCGAIGSSLAELLVRQGVTEFHLWDFDKVESHNIVNQMYRDSQIDMPKTDALEALLTEINPSITCIKHGKYMGQSLSGFVFSAVDSISVRREIVESNWLNPNIKLFCDFRMTLLEGQHYATDWSDENSKQQLLDSMDFTDEEAKALTPVSACGFELSVAPTVRAITAYGVANFMSFVNGQTVKKIILTSPFTSKAMAL